MRLFQFLGRLGQVIGFALRHDDTKLHVARVRIDATTAATQDIVNVGFLNRSNTAGWDLNGGTGLRRGLFGSSSSTATKEVRDQGTGGLTTLTLALAILW